MSWKPLLNFEEELCDFNPNMDYVGGLRSQLEPEPYYPRPQSHVEYAYFKETQSEKHQQDEKENEKIPKTKGKNKQPSEEVLHETIGMMRNIGIDPSSETSLDINVSIATYDCEDDMDLEHRRSRGCLPMLLEQNWFKLRARDSSPSSSSTSSVCTEEYLLYKV